MNDRRATFQLYTCNACSSLGDYRFKPTQFSSERCHRFFLSHEKMSSTCFNDLATGIFIKCTRSPTYSHASFQEEWLRLGGVFLLYYCVNIVKYCRERELAIILQIPGKYYEKPEFHPPKLEKPARKMGGEAAIFGALFSSFGGWNSGFS